MTTDRELPPCPLCNAPCAVDTGWGGWMQWMCSGKQHNGVGCISANSEGAWLELCEGPRLPTCKANKNHHALHLVAEQWDGLIANAIGQNMDTLVLAAFALMAETCRAIASTTCELYAPGLAGSDGHTTCSGRGLPECATCNALEQVSRLQVNPWPRPRPTKEPKP
jgi:hypothetical protein